MNYHKISQCRESFAFCFIGKWKGDVSLRILHAGVIDDETKWHFTKIYMFMCSKSSSLYFLFIRRWLRDVCASSYTVCCRRGVGQTWCLNADWVVFIHIRKYYASCSKWSAGINPLCAIELVICFFEIGLKKCFNVWYFYFKISDDRILLFHVIIGHGILGWNESNVRKLIHWILWFNKHFLF